jgi:redox-sensing transcriptional repressor
VIHLVDVDETKVGTTIAGIDVRHLDDLPELVSQAGVTIGVIATPGATAQVVADRLVDAGVTAILNFAPVVLTVPRGVSVRKVDLAVELQILSFYQQRLHGTPVTPVTDGTAASA